MNLENYMFLVGIILPFVQEKLNEMITEDVKLFGRITVTQTEQRSAISFLLSAITGAIIATIEALKDGTALNWQTLGTLAASIYVTSQAVYYATVKRSR